MDDDGRLIIPDCDFCIYLRSFSAEHHYQSSTYRQERQTGLALGVAIKTVEQQMHPGYFLKECINSFNSRIKVIEALNLSESRKYNWRLSPPSFSAFCLYEFPDWDRRIAVLCQHAAVIILHLDDRTDGLRTEFSIACQYPQKTVIFYPKSLTNHIAAVFYQLEQVNSWKAVVEYNDLIDRFSGSITHLDALEKKNGSAKAIRLDSAWIGALLS